MLEKRRLGTAGPEVGVIGLGTVKFGRTAGLKLARPAELPSDERALAVLTRAAELGVNLIDTAPAYGVAEERLGALLPKATGGAGWRSRWVLCGKVGEVFEADADGADGAGGVGGRSRYDFSAKFIRASLEASVRRLGTDHLDVALLHFSSSVDDVAVLKAGEAMGALAEAKRVGLVRAIGASTGSVAGGLEAVRGGACAVVMLTLNRLSMADAGAAAEAGARGVGVLVKKALASGHAVVGGGGGGADVEGALRMVLGTPGVGCAVVGTTSVAHLEEAVRAARG
ncbi:MAG: aldo/keto reductase [bacterium]